MSRTSNEPHEYWSGAHTNNSIPKHRLRYHLVFVPKYRKRVLDGKVAIRLEQLLRQACEIKRWRLEELAIQPDHVHLLVQIQPKYSVSQVMRRLKAGDANTQRRHEPGFACGVSGDGRVFMG